MIDQRRARVLRHTAATLDFREEREPQPPADFVLTEGDEAKGCVGREAWLDVLTRKAKPRLTFDLFFETFNHMVASSAEALDATFHALAHPTRRAMLAMLADGEEYTVGELAAPFNVSLAASSKHLIVLEKAQLVRRRRLDGRTHACRLNATPLRNVVDWTEEFRHCWKRNFDKFDTVLEGLESESKRRRKGKR